MVQREHRHGPTCCAVTHLVALGCCCAPAGMRSKQAQAPKTADAPKAKRAPEPSSQGGDLDPKAVALPGGCYLLAREIASQCQAATQQETECKGCALTHGRQQLRTDTAG